MLVLLFFVVAVWSVSIQRTSIRRTPFPPPVINRSCQTRSYPLYKQCDSRWGSIKIGTSSKTICRIGCLMSSVSMAMKGCGLSVAGQTSTPKTLDHWLTRHHGYVSGSLFVWGSVNTLGLEWAGFQYEASGMVDAICADRVVILNVNHGGHYVLATGVNNNGEFLVNDPGYKRSTYKFSEVKRAGIYDC